MSYSAFIKEKLLSLINEMDQYHWLFTHKPEKDFSRIKKWSFGEVVKFIITMEGKSLKDELLEHFDFSTDTPTNSSFNQRRAQILPEAFEFLFREFTAITSGNKKFHGYRLLACDGSDLCIAHNPQDTTTYFQSTPDSKGFNQMHLNVLYDLLARTYVDAVIQPARQENEYQAMCEMIDRYSGDSKSIFIADRGYESYNIFAHVLEKGLFFLIRAKDITSSGIANSFRSQFLDDQSSFDKTVTVTLTKKQTNAVKAELDKYRIIPKASTFDFVDLHHHWFYEMKLRIVRFPIADSSYECIITNLPPEEFSPEDIKELYHIRWGIETSFRELKYSIGLTHFHSKKPDYIKQEIWARLILYNFCEAITARTIMRQSNRKRKHSYQLNYTRAIHICRFFLSIRKGAPPDVEFLISRELLPVRPGRTDPRKVKPQAAVSFLYRVA
ncbi:MAG: IS4 family transposase [Oscillospiraceae bacterium]|nr:IS4 family transposase [Oscillospiraceae bacterium]